MLSICGAGRGGAGRGAAGGGRMEWDVGGKVKRKGKYVHLWFIHVDE